MTNFGDKTKKIEKEKHNLWKCKEYIYIFILPIVAISQRSIPKDHLYENNKNRKKINQHRFLLSTTKISSFFYFYSMYYNNFSPHVLLHVCI